MKRRDFIKAGGVMLSLPAFAPKLRARPKGSGRMLILGFDGMDPDIIHKMAGRGELPNIQKFIEQKRFRKMLSTVPAESPCAWSSFATGMDPGGHGIFGFLHRVPGTYNPGFNLTETQDSKKFVKMGDWKIPRDKGGIYNNRKGKPFWDYLQERDVDCTVFKMPANYPPTKMKKGRALAGLGTPDIYGQNGLFTLYTSDPDEAETRNSKGKYEFAYIDPNNVMEGQIDGPLNTFKVEPEPTYIPFRVYVDQKRETIRIDIQGNEILLGKGKMSRWVDLKFDLIPNIKAVKAMVQFYLLNIGDTFRLYISPPSIHPSDPAQPISDPMNYSEELGKEVGAFHTLGLPADFNAIRAEAFSMENYITQSDSILGESLALFDYEFNRFLSREKNMLFFYFSSIDQGSHIYWALRDPEHPNYRPEEARRFGDQIEVLYRKFDTLVGDVMKKLPPDARLIILSDHGFAPMKKKVDLNAMLYQEGLLHFNGEIDYSDSLMVPRYGDWDRTRAFAMGVHGGIYLNLRGREPNGIIAPEDKRKNLEQIKQMLLSMKDPLNGRKPIDKVFILEDIYSKEYLELGPDILIGYNRDYAFDSGAALGGLGKEIYTENMSRWTGDHIIDPHQVPAVLMTNFDLTRDRAPRIWDLAPTILQLYGIPVPDSMRGKSLV